MSAPPKRTGSLGLLGVVSICFLAAVSYGQIRILLRLDPDWLDRRAFWRAPLVEPYSDGTESVSPPPEVVEDRPAPEPDRVQVFENARATARCTPESGGEVRDPGNGATVILAPGSLREPQDVSLAMIRHVPAAMQRPTAGPAYEVKIGTNDHYVFARPARIEIPYVRGVVKDDNVVVSVWERGRWTDLPSRVDRERGVVSAEMKHASSLGLGIARGAILLMPEYAALAAAGVVLAVANESPTIRSAAFAAYYGLSKEYETPEGNFKIHYYTSGAAAIPADVDLMPGAPPTGEAPIYVRRMGHFLESARRNMEEEGYDVPPAKLIRYDAFVVPLGKEGDNLGESPPGGPLFISSRLRDIAGSTGIEMDALMQHTVVHELHHVAQGRYYSKWRQLIHDCGAFVEAATEFEAWRYAKKTGLSFPYHDRYFVADYPDIPSYSLPKSGNPDCYAYSSLFEWFYRHHGDHETRDFIRTVHWERDGSLASIDSAARKAFAGKSLADLFVPYALDFYHNDMWKAELLPALHRRSNVFADVTSRKMSGAFKAVGTLNRASMKILARHGSSVERCDAASYTCAQPLGPMSAHAITFHCDSLLPPRQASRKQRGKLYLDVQAPGSGSLRVFTVAGRSDGGVMAALPLKGRAGEVTELVPQDGRFKLSIDDVGSPDGPNLATLVLVNTSLSTPVQPSSLSRVLLEPPPVVELDRPAKGVEPRAPTLRWVGVNLATFPKYFGGYRVYSRSLDNMLLPPVLEKTIGPQEGSAPSIWWTMPPGVDSPRKVFEVVTVDREGNESFPRQALDRDPFVGVWRGSFRLVNGSVVEAIAQGFKNAERLPNGTIPADVAREIDRVAAIARPFELLAKAGVDAEIEIALRGDIYTLRVVSVADRKLEEPEPGDVGPQFKRVSPTVLRMSNAPRDWPIFDLKIHRLDETGERPNVIRETGFVARDFVEGVKSSCTLAWTFTRQTVEEQ